MKLTTVNIQGNIFTGDILEKIRKVDIRFQEAADFHLKPNESVRDEINNAWSLLNTYWQIFKQKRDNQTHADTGTSETRKYWMIPLFNLLGYEIAAAKAELVNEKSYAVSHRAVNKGGFPIHIIGNHQSLDKKAESGMRISPHALVQEYLNYTEHLYGFVTNGLQLRVLRDASHLSKLNYVEFNLEQMMEEGQYSEFALLYRLLHASRVSDKKEDSAESVLEFYHNEALASGSRIRERLNDAVYHCIIFLATGFLQDPNNDTLRSRIRSGEMTAQKYYSQILKVVYRILFLNVIEERDLVFASDPDETMARHKQIYNNYYSFSRLIKLADKKVFVDAGKKDLWDSIKTTFRLFEEGAYGGKLSIKPLGFGLFSPNAITDLDFLEIKNEVILKVVDTFCFFKNENGQRTRVNYADLNVEELGSVYEGLLSLSPKIYDPESQHPFFNFTNGMDRKETASYYTHQDLVRELIKSALIPLIKERIQKAGPDKGAQQQAILNFKVCDPSVGSGHTLLEAARTLAYYYVKAATDTEPTPAEYRHAGRLVIQHCLYGVDANPEAVELCKLALWLEGHNSGAPLSFLDHKIRVGNSLVGVRDPELMNDGIPDEAYKVEVDVERNIAQLLKSDNQRYKKTLALSLDLYQNEQSLLNSLNQEHEDLIEIDQDSLEDVIAVQKKHEKLINNPQWYQEWTRCNLWCTPFFAKYTEANQYKIPTTETLVKYRNAPSAVDGRIIGYANSLSVENKFFHWYLEFPEVYAQGGFDLMIGNPPWEVYELKETEFFQNKNKEIAETDKKDKRTRLIQQLQTTDPNLYKEYQTELFNYANNRRFINHSGSYPLSSYGKTNLYAIFAELFYKNIRKSGRSAMVCPTGVATDNSTSVFFGRLVTDDRLVSFFDFENRQKLFPIDSRFKFCLLTMGHKALGKKSQFAFFLHQTADLQNPDKVFDLSRQDFININPNTKTTPIFRTQKDAELTAKIYNRLPVILNEQLNQNPWGISIRQGLFNMSSDAHFFLTEFQGGQNLRPLYESKFIWFYDHRLNSFEGSEVRTQTHSLTEEEHKNADKRIQPWYWINENEVTEKTEEKYFIGFRDITNTTNERTAIFSLFPFSGVGNTMPVVTIENVVSKFLFLSNVSSLIFDFFVRQKLGGTHLNFNYVRQLPVLSPKTFTEKDKTYILPRVAELAYTAWDIKNAFDDLWQAADEELKAAVRRQWEENKAATGGHEWQLPDWAADCPEIAWEEDEGIPLPPFMWDEDRRLRLKAELDAYYALLFGLERKEVEYILDPKAVMGADFPSESFRVLQEKEIRTYGEYRTQRLVLEAYDRLRPAWPMESHLQKLQQLRKFHLQDLSAATTVKEQKSTNTSNQVSEPPVNYGGLFEGMDGGEG